MADEFSFHDEVTLNSGLETVENCLKGGEDPNRRDDYGSAPLHCVSYFDEEAHKMVQLLLNYGADMLSRDGLGRLPFQHALDHANRKSCQTFIDWGFSLEKAHRMLNGTYELLSNVELFQFDASEVLQVLVDLGVDLSATLSSRGENLLHKAIESGASIETIQFLIRAGISINSRNSLGMTPLHMLRFLDCSPTDRYDEEKSRHSKLVKLFVNEGYDINSQDIFGRALLHYVTSELRHNSILQFIISHGADMNIKDRNGVAPLHLACSLKNTANVKELFENGCLFDIADNNGATVFHYTVFYNNSTTLNYLLTQCTDSCLASKPDNTGRTPLQWAGYFGYAQLTDIFENFFRSLNKGFKRERLPDVFPLRDEFDSFKMQEEIENIQSEDFSLNIAPNRTLQKLLNSPVIGKLPEIAETQDVKTAVSKVIERVAVKVSKTCPLFTFRPEISGSVSEGTKCGSPDEFDFLCTMVKLCECFQEPTVASSPSMFCRLQIKPDLCLPDHKIMQYVDKDNSLRSAKLINDFSDQLNKAFLEKEIWEDILVLAPVSVCLMGANATKITLVWHGQVYKDMLINVDIVPALHFPNFWPPNVSETALLNSQMKEKGVHVVMALHGERFFKSGEKHFRLSFSLAETKIFQALPEQVRLGYILAKAVRSTYTCLQIAPTIETVQEQPSGSDNDHHSGCENEEPTDLSKWPEDNSITAEKEKLPSFFVPSINLLEKNYDSEQHEKVFYGGLEFHPMDEDLMQDLDDALEDTTTDLGCFRKPFIKMLKGILQSHL
ncbi:E3 ubiquitin-protein ligase [Desmophyllum pertusum]|uniref:E3 ubiquitin-protein ligase n=1 Tax=Desmophyllum pertusum TaxID=174260 RepID=A0A9X0A2A7_9CNID|nr:E3 ubiquitin-protein ligase [Desmophyllum pertusum]